MKVGSLRTLLALGISVLVATSAGAALQPMTDEEMDATPAGVSVQVSAAQRAASSSEEMNDVSLALGGTRVTRKVQTYKALRQKGVVLQSLDYSCGAAALATLVTYFLQKPTKEEEIVATILVSGQTPQEGIRKYFRRKGFTLLDLKRASEAKGFRSEGYKGMTLDDLVETLRDEQAPVLVPVKPLGYYHFVVVRGFQGDRILLADPAVGHTTMRVNVFLDAWVEGIGFVVTQRNQRNGKQAATPASTEAQGQADPGQGDTSPGSGVPPLLRVRPGQPVPDPLWLIPVIARTWMPPETVSEPYQIFYNRADRRVLSIMTLPNYNPAIQFGDPAGKWVDYSPKRGQTLTSH